MYQNINLLPKLPTLPQQKFSADVMFLGLIGWIILLLLAAGILFFVVSTRQKEVKTLKNSKSEITQSLNKIKTALQASQVGEKQEAEIDTELAAANNMINLVTQQQQKSVHGLSQYLKDLAQYTPEGLWLDAMNFIPGQGVLELQGRATEPSLIPAFLKELTVAPSFDGKHFNVLNITKPKDAQKHSYVAFEVSTVAPTAETSSEATR